MGGAAGTYVYGKARAELSEREYSPQFDSLFSTNVDTSNLSDRAKAQNFGWVVVAATLKPEKYGTEEYLKFGELSNKELSTELQAMALQSLGDAMQLTPLSNEKLTNFLSYFDRLAPKFSNNSAEVDAARIKLLSALFRVYAQNSIFSDVQGMSSEHTIDGRIQKDVFEKPELQSFLNAADKLVGTSHLDTVDTQAAFAECLSMYFEVVARTHDFVSMYRYLIDRYGIPLTSQDPKVLKAIATTYAEMQEAIARQPYMAPIFLRDAANLFGTSLGIGQNKLSVKLTETSIAPVRLDNFPIDLSGLESNNPYHQVKIDMTNTATGERYQFFENPSEVFLTNGSYTFSVSSPSGLLFDGQQTLEGTFELVNGNVASRPSVTVTLDTSSDSYKKFSEKLNSYNPPSSVGDLNTLRYAYAQQLNIFGLKHDVFNSEIFASVRAATTLPMLLDGVARQPDLREHLVAFSDFYFPAGTSSERQANVDAYGQAFAGVLKAFARQPDESDAYLALYDYFTEGLDLSKANDSKVLPVVLNAYTGAISRQPLLVSEIHELLTRKFPDIELSPEIKSEAIAYYIQGSLGNFADYKEMMDSSSVDHDLLLLRPLTADELKNHEVQLNKAAALKYSFLRPSDGSDIISYFFGSAKEELPLKVEAPQGLGASIVSAEGKDLQYDYRGYTLKLTELEQELPAGANKNISPISLKVELFDPTGALVTELPDGQKIKLHLDLSSDLAEAEAKGLLKVQTSKLSVAEPDSPSVAWINLAALADVLNSSNNAVVEIPASDYSVENSVLAVSTEPNSSLLVYALEAPARPEGTKSAATQIKAKALPKTGDAYTLGSLIALASLGLIAASRLVSKRKA